MYVQIGKPRRAIHPAIFAASGMFFGAAAGVAATFLADGKNRRIVGNTIKTTTRLAKNKASEFQQRMNDMSQSNDIEGVAGGSAKKIRKMSPMTE